MSVSTSESKPTRSLPVLQGILPIVGSQIPTEIIAGITLAALAIPEVMGYTKIAGTPVVTGLYTILIPMALFALFGSSRHLVVGADSATAAIMGRIGRIGTQGSLNTWRMPECWLSWPDCSHYRRVIRLGFLADFCRVPC
jgi:MFS superfamily sulfate permease-like transporter